MFLQKFILIRDYTESLDKINAHAKPDYLRNEG